MGYGKRLWQYMNGKDNIPGVGSYNIPSVFDKSRRTKMPIN